MPQTRHDRGEPVGATPMRAPARKRGPAAWLIPLVLAVIAAIILLLLLSRCGGGDDSSTASDPTAGTTASASSTAAAQPSAAATGSAGSGGAGGTGSVTAGGKTLVPLADTGGGDLSAYDGQTARTMSVTVQSVPADEGFWVGPSAEDRVWVQLSAAAGESPFIVKAGDSVAFTGQVVSNAKGFAKTAGVTDSEGASLLDTQGYHIAVRTSAVKLST